METPALTAAITRLFAALPLLERIDLLVADARSHGLQIDGVGLDAKDFEAFRIEAATHMLISTSAEDGVYRGLAVHRRASGESQIDATLPDGSRVALAIYPGVSTTAKTTGRSCEAVAALSVQTGAE